MPVVPFTNPAATGQLNPSVPQEMPDEKYSLMAAAMMHEQGRLVKPPETAPAKPKRKS